MKQEKRISAISLRGGRKNNEDNFYVSISKNHSEYITQDLRFSCKTKRKNCVFAVADGMGGLNCGEDASESAMLYLQNHKKLLLKSPQVFFNRINKKVKACNGGGTTFSCVVYDRDRLHCYSIGDSPIILYKISGELLQINEIDNKAAELDPDECDPLVYEQAKHYLTKFLGCTAFENNVPFHHYELKIEPGDILILATDGIDALKSSEIADACKNRGQNFPNIAEALAQMSVRTLEMIIDETLDFFMSIFFSPF